MGELVVKLFVAIIPSVVSAVLAHFFKPKAAPEQTREGALLEVAKDQAEVQHEINKINASSITVDDAITRLRKRSASAYPDGNGS